MAKLNVIELDKSVSDIVNKVFKIGGPSEKIAASVVNSLLTKMVFGDKEEQKVIITSLVPDVLSAADAMKLFNNIDKYKKSEKEKLVEFMNEIDGKKNTTIVNNSPKKVITREINNIVKKEDTKTVIADDDQL